ncbi:hypothetical protein J437_LFUL009195 [Ladona fulva]|uniref:Oligopeptide transporter 1 n=1 Tax=Ladona fulva TaxID=123851 RepID=A0A8K0P1I4_LADFU|nr:hypothetical protein J437_LFUL009195 [Ladona fulva]
MVNDRDLADPIGGSKEKEAFSNGTIETIGEQKDVETQQKKVKYPKHVFFIIGNEFCERFTYYGIRTILSIYASTMLGYSKTDATVIYHTFVLLCYFTPIFGAMLADTFLGRFRTIFYVSLVYAVGNIVLSVGAIPDLRGGAVPATIVGLLLIAAGTGGIKPCVSSFGGDQFVLPEQEKQQKQFFSVFYFAINSGSLISTFLTPVLRQDVKCFGETTCYFIAFGVPAIFMLVALALFLVGKSMYTMKKPEGNLMLRLVKLMNHSVVQKVKSKGPKKDHWLDYGSDQYEQSFIDDVKLAFKVLALFVPLPIFWALYDQQGSRWTFQAQQMNGALGSYTLKPDQMQVVNPLLILLFIPFFESVIYPLFAKCNLLTKAIQRIFVGGCLAAVAFLVSGFVDLKLEPSLAVMPSSGQGQLRIFNSVNQNCNITITNGDDIKNFELPPLGMEAMQHLEAHGNTSSTIKLSACGDLEDTLLITEGKAYEYFLFAGIMLAVMIIFLWMSWNYQYVIILDNDNVEKKDDTELSKKQETASDNSSIDEDDNRAIFSENDIQSIEVKDKDGKSEDIKKNGYKHLEPGDYKLFINSQSLESVHLGQGGVYSLVVMSDGKNIQSKLQTVTPYNDVHMMWLLPQYLIITAGEIMFSITGLEFAFTQAPASMKSLVSACWLLTDSFGNAIVIIIAEAKIFDKQVN